MDEDPDSRSQIAVELLDESRRALSFQAASLDELRSRTGLVLTASSISASLLSTALARSNDGPGPLGIVAGLAFVLSIWSCLWVLWPRKNEWIFTSSSTILKADWVDMDRGDASEMRLTLAKFLEINYDQNKTKMDRLFTWFQVGAFSVGLGVILGSIYIAQST